MCPLHVTLKVTVRLSVQTGFSLRHSVSPNLTDWARHVCLPQFALSSACNACTQHIALLESWQATHTPLDIIFPLRPELDNPASCRFAESLQCMVAGSVTAVQQILGHRTVKHGMSLITWEVNSGEHNTWEPAANAEILLTWCRITGLPFL